MSETIQEAFLQMNKERVEALVKMKIATKLDPLAILGECREAMEEVGKKFEKGEFFLGELIYSAEIFKSVGGLLEPYLAGCLKEKESIGQVVFGTPKGDIHDLGKNIVITMMRAYGFRVHDLGVDVSPEKFIDKIKETRAKILAMSCLMTTAFAQMERIVNELERSGLRKNIFVIIGGGVTTDLVRARVGADAQTQDPTHGIRLCRQYLNK